MKKDKNGLRWVDHVTGKKKSLAREGERSKHLVNLKRPPKVKTHREIPRERVAPIIKQPGIDQQGLVQSADPIHKPKGPDFYPNPVSQSHDTHQVSEQIDVVRNKQPPSVIENNYMQQPAN